MTGEEESKIIEKRLKHDLFFLILILKHYLRIIMQYYENLL